jgi:hypothetical protein
VISVATAADKRALNQHVATPGADAATTLAAALVEPPTDPKQLAWLLVWAGKVALGPRPTPPSEPRSPPPRTCALVSSGAGRYSDRSVGQRASTAAVKASPVSATSSGRPERRRASSQPASATAAAIGYGAAESAAGEPAAAAAWQRFAQVLLASNEFLHVD